VSGPLVSVVIPVYNGARFISRTLDSVSAQTHGTLEIVVVDDGSTDRTRDLVLERAAADPRIRLVRQENAGVAAARNRGIRESQGPFIAPLDADDLWHPEKIERQLRRFEERPEAGLVYCWSIGIDDQDCVFPQRVSPASFEGDVFAALVFQNFIGNASSPLIRRECLEEVGGFDESLRAARAEGCEDRKLYMDIAERHDFALEPLFLVGYRQMPGSMSWKSDQMLRSHELIMADARRRHPEVPERIFRWANARTNFYLGLRRLRSAPLEGLVFCASALGRDPSLFLSHWFRYSVGRGVGKVVGTKEVTRTPFAQSPVERPVVPAGWTVQRQRNYAASVRIERRPSRPHHVDQPMPSAGSIPTHG
jgi:glycosyltransferase involved in cell wall biosynthesis